jgi:uncharacterized iron-regulated membrane protein
MRAGTVRKWYLVHKWSSLICTLFLLMLCITGLPLIFHEEIDRLLGDEARAPALATPAPRPGLDRVVAAGLSQWPGQRVQYVVFDDKDPALVYVTLGRTPTDEDSHTVTVDARNAAVVSAPRSGMTVMDFILTLHATLFAGLAGELFLAAMGLLFAAAIVSGMVLYAPFMRRLEFGTVRAGARIKWLDLHNLIGAVSLCWALVVGVTGVLNALGEPILKLWQAGQLAEMTAPYRGKPAPMHYANVAQALATAQRAAPGMTPAFIAYPGTIYSSLHHYAVYMHGSTPFTSRLYRPALIDAGDGRLTAARDMPWYAKLFFISQPLHFGDYGGTGLKIVWALLDLLTIIVLGSGLYLWLGKRRTPQEERLGELMRGGAI